MSAATAATPLAYSYIRFSTPDQLKGDSLRRQTEATAAWCERHGVALDTRTTLRDLGVSAFKGKHRKDDKHALAGFLKLATQGRVPQGSYLVIENLDRLSREDERTALRLWMDILDAGINVVQLHPETVFRHEKSDMLDVMRAIIELSRGHSESAMKSQRNGDTWEQKRKAARAGQAQPPRRKDGRVTAALTSQLPAWVEDKGGKLRLIPAKARAVRRVYELAATGLGTTATTGMGAARIVKTLQREQVPGVATSGTWSRAYVSLLMADRRTVGEFQPKHADGTPAGDPIPGYYPACVTEQQWQAARVSRQGRKNPRGRPARHVNVFAGLLFNARDQDRYYIAARTNNGKHRRVLIAHGACENGAPVHAFPLDVFERAVLGQLRELDPKDILGDEPGQDEVVELSAELEAVRLRQEKLAAELEAEVSTALVKASRALDAREKELRERLAAAERQAAFPAGESWGEAMSVMDALDQAPDVGEARHKLQTLLRVLVKEIWLLVVPLSETRRVAVVQVFFQSGAVRHYLVFVQAAGYCRKGGWWSRSLAEVAGLAGEGLDLRQRDHVRQLDKALAKVDLAAVLPGAEGPEK
jgi:DNA invertase Pin-like site-specific DNA recombinase